jgi:hypothetical protein
MEDKEKGNGDLTYPVGLITADEISIAGGVFSTENTGYYLYKGVNYRSFTPGYFNSENYASVFIDGSNGNIYDYYVYYTGEIAPVINLTVDYFTSMSGDGTATNPYTAE